MKNLTIVLLVLIVSFCCCRYRNNTEQTVAGKTKGFDKRDIDTSQNPCLDFDSFANGNWKKANPLPATESRWGAFEILDRENKVKLRQLVDSIAKIPSPKVGTETQQIADFYRSFIDTTTIEQLGLKPLDAYLQAIDQIHSIKDWVKVTGTLQNMGVPTFITYSVEADAKNNKMQILYLRQGGLSMLDQSYYRTNEHKNVVLRKQLIEHIDLMWKLAGFTSLAPGETIYSLEQQVAKLQLSSVMLRDQLKTYNKIGTATLIKRIPQFDWEAFLKAQDISTPTLVVEDMAYLENLVALLQRTPLSTLKVYTKWQFLSHFAPYLSKKYQLPHFAFFGTAMAGKKAEKSRPERAIEETEKVLGMPLGKLFVAKYFQKQHKEKVRKMIENVRSVYHRRIDDLNWMSRATKVAAHDKLKAMTFKIGYPEKWDDYSSMAISPSQLLANVIAAARFHHQERIAKIDQPVTKNEWHSTPQTVDAFYDQYTNSACFPAGILQPPFYNDHADDAINYGAIIAVIGHEITHAFDDRGSKFDASGNLHNWWTVADRRNFEDLANQYINYFNRIEGQPGLHINGQLTISENIADLGGLTLAYYALKKSYVNQKAPALIDGFTWQQRFFLGWAQMWHSNISEEALRNELQTNPHIPFRFRINGPLAQLQEFKQAWGCDKKTKETGSIVIW